MVLLINLSPFKVFIKKKKKKKNNKKKKKKKILINDKTMINLSQKQTIPNTDIDIENQ